MEETNLAKEKCEDDLKERIKLEEKIRKDIEKENYELKLQTEDLRNDLQKRLGELNEKSSRISDLERQVMNLQQMASGGKEYDEVKTIISDLSAMMVNKKDIELSH